MTACRAWALSLALLLAQALGLHHGVAHGAMGSWGPSASVQVPAAGLATGQVHADHRHGPDATALQEAPAGAFHADHDAGDAQCRLVDQVGHAELLWLSLPSTAVVPADRPAANRAPWSAAPDAAHAPYQARGPP